MAAPALIPCLVKLRSELNRLAPQRDKSSDGWIGDRPHQARISDHNDDETGRVPVVDADDDHEVHAVDLDADLNTPGLTMEMVVQHVVSRCRSGAEKRLRYVIYNRRIWEGPRWIQRTYAGDNAHIQHAHFSGSYDTKLEASTASWRLEDIEVALTEADKKWLSAQINTSTKAIRDDLANRGVLEQKIGDKANPNRTVADVFRDVAKLRGVLVGDGPDTSNAKLPADSPLARLIKAADDVLNQQQTEDASTGK